MAARTIFAQRPEGHNGEVCNDDHQGPQRAGLSAKLSPKEFLKDCAGTTSYSTANSFLNCLAMSQSMFIQ